MSKKGSVKVVYGPMFSNKTVTLIDTCLKSEITTFPIKPIKDTRYDSPDEIVSNNTLIPKLKAHKTDLLMNLHNKLPPLPCLILVDEGQFFEDLLSFTRMAVNEGYQLFIATLDTTFERKLWKPIEALFEDKMIAPYTEFIPLKSTCYKCQEEAEWSKRTIASKELCVVGGSESYVPCCTKCW